MPEQILTDVVSTSLQESSQDSITGLFLRKALKRYWLPAAVTAAIFAIGNVLYIQTRIPLYRENILLLVGNQSMVPVLPSTDLPIAELGSKSLSTEITILTSSDLLQQVIPKLEPQFQQPDWSVDSFLDNLSVQQVKDADVLTISYTDTNPKRVKSVLDVLGKIYVDYSLQNSRSQVSNAIRFIEDQLPSARQELEQSALMLRNFQEQNQIIDPAVLAGSISSAQQVLRQQQATAQISIDKYHQEKRQLEQQLIEIGQDPQRIVQESILGQDTLYQNLVMQLQQVDLQLAQERPRFQDKTPRIQALANQRANIQALLESQANHVLRNSSPLSDQNPSPSRPFLLQDSLSPQSLPSTTGSDPFTDSKSLSTGTQLVQGLAQKLVDVQISLAVQTTELQSLSRAEASLGNQLAQIPSLQQTYVELLRQNDLNSTIVNNFLKQLQELKISEAQEISPWRVIQSAEVPELPVSPQKGRMAIMGLIGSLMAGIGMAYLLNRIDDQIRTLDEAKEVAQLPILGRVPKLDFKPQAKLAAYVTAGSSQEFPANTSLKVDSKETKAELIQARKRLFFQESFRSIALNLRYMATDRPDGKVLAVTSSVPSEGKSTCVFNLSMSLAQLGHRVLVVDGDLRRPRQHELFQEINASGLSSLFATHRTWQDLVHPALEGQLQVLTSGPCPPDPSALLSSSQMERLFQDWRQSFDYILVDTPPISGVADTAALSIHIDGLIFVLCLGVTPRPVAQRALESLRAHQIPIVGMVINQDDETSDGYYGYYSYYSGSSRETQSSPSHSLKDPKS